MAVFDLILIGLAVTLEPIPVTGFILILGSERGRVKGAAFIAAWVVSLVVVVVVVVVATIVVTGGKPPKPATSPSTGVLAAKILFGVILIAFAFHRRARAGAPKKKPIWMTKLDHLSPWAAAGIGVILQPWVLIAAGAATVAQLHVSSLQSYLLLVVFCLLCTASILGMELYAVFDPGSAASRLDGLRNWIDTHRDRVIVTLSLIVGPWLVGDSSYLMASQ